MPSGEERVVNARKEMLEAMCGPGWLYSSISLPSLLLVDEVPVPATSNGDVRRGLFSGPKERTVP